MATITIADYKTLADKYTAAQEQIAGVSQHYYDAAYLVVGLQTFDPEIDLLTPFYNAYLSSEVAYARAPQSVITAVRSLQQHVLRRATSTEGTRFTDINDWYAENTSEFTGQLSPEFAVLSEQAGYRIEDGSTGDAGDFVGT